MATKKQSVNQNFTMEDVLRAGYRIRPEPELASVASPEPEPSRGTLRAVADVGLEAASGAAKGIKFMSDVFGASNPVSQGLQGVSDVAKELQSAQAKGEDRRIAQLMKEAEDKGVAEQVKAGLRAAGEAPVRQAIGALGTSVPMIAASMVPGLREASWGTRAAALGGVGAAQGVGVVKSQMYDSVHQRAIEEGRSEQEARALAQRAQAYSPENAGDIALGGVLGAGAALTGFEPAAARAIGQTAAKGVQRGLMQSTLRGVAAEAVPEAIQGGQEQVAGNQAQQRAGFDTPTFRGVAGSATLEGVLSAPGGAVGGMLDVRGTRLPPKTPGDQIRATELVPQSGPMTRAANQAVEAKAQQVEMTAGAENAALAAMEKQAQVDLQGLRDFAGRSPEVVAGMPAAGAQPEAAGIEPSAEFIDSPFLDRIQTVQEMLADSTTRDKVRERWGDEGLNNIAYYAGMANRTGLPEKTQDNLLGMAERLPSESVLTPIQPTPELGGMRPDPLTLGSQPQLEALALGMDTIPSGRFTVDPQGNVAPESRVQAMDAQRRADEAASLGEQTPRGQQIEPEPTAQGPIAIGMDTAPTGRLLAGQDGVRPETRMDAINIGQADMQRQADVARRAELGLTPDIEAVQLRSAMRPLDGDILNPSGNPFKTKMAVQLAAKKTPGEIVEVTGGFVIRPATMVTPQAGDVNDGRGDQTAAGFASALAGSNLEAGDRAVAEPAAPAPPGEVLDAVPGQPGAAEQTQGDVGQGQQVGEQATADQAPEAARGNEATPAGVPDQGGSAAALETVGVEQPQPAAITIAADDVAAAEKQAAQQIADRIDGMKAQEAQKVAARFLPTIGVKVPLGKARIKAVMTDAVAMNLLGPAGELGIELSDSVKRVLTAKMEGRVGEAVAPVASVAAQLEQQNPQAEQQGDNSKWTSGFYVKSQASKRVAELDAAKTATRLVDTEATSIATAITSRWANAPEVVVVADMQDAKVPQEVRDYDAEQRSQGAEGDPEGFWHENKVYLVADAMRDPSDVMRVLFHEALGHYGLRGVFGDSLKPILQQIAAMRRAEVQAKADEYGLDIGNKEQRLQAAEEVLATMAQTKPELGYVKRAIAAIRGFLRRMAPKLFSQMKLTDAEIVRDYILPARAFVERGSGGGMKANDLVFSRSAAKDYAGQVMDKLNETFNHPGKLSWWHKTVGSMYNLAERMPAFKPVYDAAQNFINDVSFYAIEAADKAPKLLPRLENWSDLAKSPITTQDNRAVAAPVFEGTLSWRRDESGKPALVEDLVKRYAGLTPDQKAQRLLRSGAIAENVLKMWQGMPQAKYEASVNTAFEGRLLKAGIVFTPDELGSIFKLNGAQVKLYQEFRQSIDASLDNMGKSDLLRVAGKDAADLKDAVMSTQDIDAAATLLRDHLLKLAKENSDRSDELATVANDMIIRAEKVQRLKMEGYAPLSRFGQYTVDVVVDGERQYFGIFETARDANRMASKLRMEYGAKNVAQGTLSQREFEMLQGITPETLELFGNMLGLDSTGNEAQDQAFQEYLKRTKANRSAMKRLIHRKGIAGYSEDVGRVLAAFVYSNARQTSAALHMGDLGEAVMAIPKGEGELKDAAVELARYVKEPREEAAKMRGWLFAQYLGGSIASAIVNFTQPLTTSAPYLSQFGGMGKSVKALYQAMVDLKGLKFEAGLAESFRQRTEDGTLAPQGVHELMAQSRGEATLRTGDGTQVGDALAKGRNTMSKVMIGWGKLFGIAEQINRQSTYVAAYRMAAERGMADPDAFAKKVVDETQFVNNKANKMKFGRGAIGATLMTFKSYSLNWLELFHRLATQNGREGRMAAAWMVGVLLLSAGASGLPFAEDAEDLADFLAQRLGYNWSSKKARQEFLESLFGRDIAGLVENGITGLPGAPIDVSGRLGMGNLIPGTGLLLKKKDHASDFTEVLGPAGDLAKRTFQAGDLLLSGNVKQAALAIAPKAISNLEKGVDMASTGLYRDARGYKVDDATAGEAIGKAIGFQPRSVAQIQEASSLNQRAKDFYRLKVEGINAKWAKAIFEKDSAAVDEVRAEIKGWNRQNPDQRIQANIPAILRRVKEMRKPKADRIADTAPKAMRASMREEVRKMQEEMR